MTSITSRLKELFSFSIPSLALRPASALREKFHQGYTGADFQADILSGIIVGTVALPLGMALAIASGVPPQLGLYTVVIAGGAVALLGGSRFQVTGPTAAFVVILVPVVHKFGVSGLLVAGLLAGVLLVAMGLARMGQLIQFIPYPVTTGFTSGIALVIATLQIKDFFGLHPAMTPDGFAGRLHAYWQARGTWSPADFLVGAVTLAILILWPRVHKRIPSPVIALGFVTIATVVAHRLSPAFNVATIGSRFSSIVGGVTVAGIPPTPPSIGFPWRRAVDGSSLPLNFATIHSLAPSAFAIAMLAAIESLLSAVVSDAMAQTRHDPDAELLALGVGNILCPFFGGIPATGAIART
ncbi:MAG: C4-dicarboxylic acid transporter DauA, partial [Elusimicrobia bacterium]|nr:C4-dicarboxylic acid transporter DauA [Elusimicrobiota bacterium]